MKSFKKNCQRTPTAANIADSLATTLPSKNLIQWILYPTSICSIVPHPCQPQEMCSSGSPLFRCYSVYSWGRWDAPPLKRCNSCNQDVFKHTYFNKFHTEHASNIHIVAIAALNMYPNGEKDKFSNRTSPKKISDLYNRSHTFYFRLQ